MKLTDRYDAFLVDLDGVIWRGEEPIPQAPETIGTLRGMGKRVVFVTNNASRSARDYAAKLIRMRIPTEPSDVIGSAHAVVEHLLAVARELHLERIFVLTFEVDFFGGHGFEEIDGTPVTSEVYEEMCRSYDIGVAEFLDLSYVKPNILGNSRMLLIL